MFILPLFLLLFPPDSLKQTPVIGLSIGTGLPYGGNGIHAQIRQNRLKSGSTAIFGGLGISLGGTDLPETDYWWINNALGVQWEKGRRHRLLFSAGLCSSTLAAQRPKHSQPEKKFVIGPMASAGYCLRSSSGFHFQTGISLVLLQNPLENSRTFFLNPAPFAGLGWSWPYRKNP